ncbi:transcriptional regulator, MerR family [Pediococcus damnosus]|uniref:Transcriptional regulator, MerR family n=4 Tax=Pediococcus damnosus TaxID=51663 RepID=A0A143AFZ7_9LACO|nr:MULTISPECIES: MerR family transcriptional regulator [Pediococcus]AMV60270.1 transcriptional regulator, MerR family [Pediococcus damnosus]AMV62801.1 transcriptional regulator, MerR family [Pediococcus damnosus]AMV64520.1 transcriptional regulator, MerR family [Pediococcus damnosus]AMV67314.1 transcriptional regulator, MerR family [Pediococcus damnosus]AMV69617.1 transcriptional regulator, MerR family [Pediococcus damnosus]
MRMEIDKDFIGRMKKIMQKDNFLLGIGDIARATGVSQRKLRYWEKKGYISPDDGIEERKHRKYSYYTLAQVSMIESYVKTGFTLSAAVEKTNQHDQVSQAIRKFISDRLTGLVTVDNGFEIDLGEVCDVPNKHLFAILKGNEDTKLVLKDNNVPVEQ